jgi:uncharacterized protein (UPF0261 family)
MADVILLATLDTKASEAQFLRAALERRGLNVELVDLSLGAQGAVWPGDKKLAQMQAVSEAAGEHFARAVAGGARAAIGIGGGSGGEMILRIMGEQPVDFPQILVTTLPFDPRSALARSAIILVPTLIDFSGLNDHMRNVLERSAGMIAGLISGLVDAPATSHRARSIAVSVLGATQCAADALLGHMNGDKLESALFHANGYGGASLVRFAREGRLRALIDLTPHELTRLHINGAHVAMPDRFAVAGEMGLPQVILPGGLNFIGLGSLDTLTDQYKARSHYAHSGFFTHVKVTPDEMARLAQLLAFELKNARAPVTIIIPMGGFSHQDCSGGAIEDADLRRVFLDVMTAEATANIKLQTISAHINHPETAFKVFDTIKPFLN